MYVPVYLVAYFLYLCLYIYIYIYMKRDIQQGTEVVYKRKNKSYSPIEGILKKKRKKGALFRELT